MKACVFTLGCKLNEAESDSLMQGLAARGYQTTAELCEADLYLLNTCAVTAEAERKSRQAVARMRKFNPSAPVIVFGCAAQHHAQDFGEKEGVIVVSGAMHKDRILEILDLPPAQWPQARGDFSEETSFCELPTPERTRTRAYLRIQDGCNRFCSYCLIPYLRGRSRSRPLAGILAEARASAAREIVLTGVDVSSWHDGTQTLGDLLFALGEVPARIRLSSLEVSAVTDEFLLKAKNAGTMPHFHLSLQSGSDTVLRRMNRHYTRAQYLAVCRKIREVFPDAAITTDIIVGFPEETEEEFSASLSIVGEAGFAKVHAFPYSPREGTRAAALPDTPPDVKHARMARLLEAGETAAERFSERFLGSVRTALFESDGGYTDNYLRVICPTAHEGGMYEVRLQKKTQDGILCEILREI